MEPKFVIKHSVTFERYKEWAKNPVTSNAIEKRKKSMRLNIAGYGVGALLVVMGVLSGKLYILLIGSGSVVIYLLSLFFMPNRRIRKAYDSILKVMNSNQWIRTITFSDKIAVDDGRTNTNFEYSEISKVMEDNIYYYLFFNADMALRVPKDSFTLGSPDDFKVFINNAATNKGEYTETEEEDLGL